MEQECWPCEEGIHDELSDVRGGHWKETDQGTYANRKIPSCIFRSVCVSEGAGFEEDIGCDEKTENQNREDRDEKRQDSDRSFEVRICRSILRKVMLFPCIGITIVMVVVCQKRRARREIGHFELRMLDFGTLVFFSFYQNDCYHCTEKRDKHELLDTINILENKMKNRKTSQT